MTNANQRRLGSVFGLFSLPIFLACGCGGPSPLPESRAKPDQVNADKPASSAIQSGQKQSQPNKLWTKSVVPNWASDLPPKVRTAFSEMMNDQSPLYTGVFCNGQVTKIYVSRLEWKQLNRFQATNNLMIAILLPHTDNTVIEYLDDNSGEKLATFTPKQKTGSITVVHP